MDNTALHTFLFHCPPALRSIVLLGSWDNFSRPYPLELDARRGHDIWKGCFTFSDIICDGDLDEQSTRRDGLLKMGGTYWYYYKVDEDEECHNPAEPSTTVCPLLPGQRLNVLEIPRERHSRSNSETSATFTRNPRDRYLTPVPPASLRPSPSLRPGSKSSSSYSMSPTSPWASKSATYVPADQYLSPNVMRHARSASASPHMPSTPIFPDFKVLKEKLASKRSASRIRSSSKPKELEIGSPVLVSSTVDEESLIPLSVYHPRLSRSVTPVATTRVTRSIPSIRKQFSPLASNPVDPILDGSSNISELPANEDIPLRRRSHVPSTVITSEFKISQCRIRANSADTRRTQHHIFSNNPWLSSPKLEEEAVGTDQIVEDDTPAAPTLRRHISHLDLPDVCKRPITSHGSDCCVSLQESLLNKDLPALPRYITPAPLFARNDLFADTAPAELEGDDTFEDRDPTSEFALALHSKPRSHFSTWSRDSLASSYPTSDDDVILSPTFSSLTSSCGNSPQRLATYSYTSPLPPLDSKRATILYEESSDMDDDAKEASDVYTRTAYLSPTPPQLANLRISSFASDLFTPNTPPHTDTAARRQATCFGLAFQYILPDDETTSKTTTQTVMAREPAVAGQRESSGSQLTSLIDEFAFLGDAVI